MREASKAAFGLRVALIVAGLALVVLGAVLPVEAVVRRAIPAGVIQEIQERGTPERIVELQEQLRDALAYFRGAVALLGAWTVLLSALWGVARRWAGEARLACEPAAGEASGVRRWGYPAFWAVVTVLVSIPLLFKGYEHEELLVLEMMAKRGPVISAACQNLPPRAAQPAYTIIESFVVKAFGDSEAVARFPALLFGALAMFPVFFIARRFGSLRLANVVCALLSTTGFYHFYINYARGYAPAMTGYLVCLCVMLSLRRRSPWRDWVLLAALCVFSCYAHLAAAVFIAFSSVILLANRKLMAWRAARSVAGVARAMVQPVVALGSAVLVLFVLYSPGIPASLDYMEVFDLTQYYMAYHINARFLKIVVESWAWLRGISPAAWVQFGIAVLGFLLACRRSISTSIYLFLPLAAAVVVFGVKGLFVYPRYFLFFVPLYVLCTALPLELVSLTRFRYRRAAVTGLIALWCVGSALSMQRLYAMERCGARTALRDAQAMMTEGERVMAVLDSSVTVRHYYPKVVSGFKDTEFWRQIKSERPPEYVISVPFLEMDIPGATEALEERYDLYRAYPSWLDVDDDQDAMFLYRRKGLQP